MNDVMTVVAGSPIMQEVDRETVGSVAARIREELVQQIKDGDKLLRMGRKSTGRNTMVVATDGQLPIVGAPPSAPHQREPHIRIGSVGLTLKQVQVLNAMCLGYSTKDMASMFNLSRKTCESHRTRLFKRLGARNAPHAVYLAVSGGFEPRRTSEMPELEATETEGDEE